IRFLHFVYRKKSGLPVQKVIFSVRKIILAVQKNFFPVQKKIMPVAKQLFCTGIIANLLEFAV
ncbi:MAG: hypothetical protein MJ184_10260, partial [Treponema sp.]|uniref:hypothetical protein n=1 Tax=Treponema sp. TaxID=166 RepID=UPI00298E311F